MDDFVEVIRRLNRVPRPKSEGAPVGISAERVRTIAVRMNMQGAAHVLIKPPEQSASRRARVAI